MRYTDNRTTGHITNKHNHNYTGTKNTHSRQLSTNFNTKSLLIDLNQNYLQEEEGLSNYEMLTTNRNNKIYPSMLSPKINKELIITQRQSAQMQLRLQLESQIRQLLPVREAICNLQQYYNQINHQYSMLLKEMHHIDNHYRLRASVNNITMNDDGCWQEFNKREDEKLVRTLSSPINTPQRIGEQLRQLQVQYEEKSEYLSIHLNSKLTENRRHNMELCKQFNQLEQRLSQVGQQDKKSLLLETNIIQNQYSKIKTQLEQENKYSKQIRNRMIELQITLERSQSQIKHYTETVNQIKCAMQQKHLRQTQLLQKMIVNKQLNSKLQTEEQLLQQRYKIASQLHQQRLNRVQNNANKLVQKQQLICSLRNKIQLEQNSLEKTQQQIKSIRDKLNRKMQLLKIMKEQQLPQQQHKYQETKQQLVKNNKFLGYLKQYQKQLKQTSKEMFLKLIQSVREDYDKLTKTKHTKINNNITDTPTIRQCDAILSNRGNCYKDQVNNIEKINRSMFDFSKESVQELIKRRAALQLRNKQIESIIDRTI